MDIFFFIKVQANLESTQISDLYTSKTKFPEILSSVKTNPNDDLLVFVLETNPSDPAKFGKDLFVTIKALPIQVVFNPSFVFKIGTTIFLIHPI